VIQTDVDLAASLARGYTLPASWYVDSAVFAAEKQQIFRRCWQYAGLAEDLSRPGDFFTYEAGDVPLIVLRDRDGCLRAFVNVCRHRGSQLILESCGNRKSLQCGYHAWTYDLDGSLRAAPGEKAEAGFDRAEFHLAPAQVDTWGPFVFVNPDPGAPPLAEVLGELPRLVDETGIELSAIRRRRRDRYEIAANWKVVVDNYLECYHCPVAHPAFADLIDLDQYTIRTYDAFSTQTGPVTDSARTGKRSLYSIGEGVEAGFYVYLWPNFMLNIYPGPGNVSLNLILPAGVDRTVARYEYCFVEAVGDEEVSDFVRFIDQVQREDTALCESVQRGLASGAFGQGKLMLSRERALQHFQQLLFNAALTPR
jgi:phenylpropionate dioxygenase-like ring-hydroxylating dioxygenase large terminal subunit